VILRASFLIRKTVTGLKAKLAAADTPPLLHPEMATIYRAKVTELARALQEPDSRSEATEALRGLVDAIVLTPNNTGEALQIEHLWLRGLATSGTCSCGAGRRD